MPMVPSCINPRHDFEVFQEDINKIYDWFTKNFLQANAKKTKAMVISTKHNPYPDLQFHLNNQAIERVKEVLHPRPVFGLFVHFSQKLQHIGNK